MYSLLSWSPPIHRCRDGSDRSIILCGNIESSSDDMFPMIGPIIDTLWKWSRIWGGSYICTWFRSWNWRRWYWSISTDRSCHRYTDRRTYRNGRITFDGRYDVAIPLRARRQNCSCNKDDKKRGDICIFHRIWCKSTTIVSLQGKDLVRTPITHSWEHRWASSSQLYMQEISRRRDQYQ